MGIVVIPMKKFPYITYNEYYNEHVFITSDYTSAGGFYYLIGISLSDYKFYQYDSGLGFKTLCAWWAVSGLTNVIYHNN